MPSEQLRNTAYQRYENTALPFFVGVLLVSFTFLGASLFGLDQARFPMPSGDGLAISAVEPAARMAWALSYCALCVSCVLLLGYSFIVFRRNLDATLPWSRVIRIAPWVASIVGAVTALLSPVTGGFSSSVFGPIVELTGNNPPVVMLIRSMGALAAGSTIYLVFALSATLVTPGEGHFATETARKSREALGLLYLATLCLVAGVAQVSLLLRWPTAFMIDEQSRQALLHTASVVGVTSGAGYTFSLMVLFLPVGAIHDRWRDDVCRRLAREDTGFDRVIWERNVGLDRSAFTSLSTMVAIGAPLAAAALLNVMLSLQ